MTPRRGRRPRRPYSRTRRDLILALCRAELRPPTWEERTAISSEGLEMAEAGYHLASILDEDEAAINSLIAYIAGDDPDDDDDDTGGVPALRLSPPF